MASRILGMGDVLSLVEQVSAAADQEQARKLAGKLASGRGFDFADLRMQLAQLRQLGGVAALADKLPAQALPPGALAQVDDRSLRRQIGIIDSMTPGERRRPALIDGSRKRRIATGAGVQVQEVNRLLKQFVQMEKVMKQMKGGGLARLLRRLPGRLPGGPGPRR
jgi:signal recognition particle subunit SRP54